MAVLAVHLYHLYHLQSVVKPGGTIIGSQRENVVSQAIVVSAGTCHTIPSPHHHR